MKDYIKNEIKHIPMIIVMFVLFYGITTLASSYLFKANEVEFDNTNTNIESTNVGDAIDELYTAANNFATYDTRLQGVETKIGSDALNTTSKNLSGAVNEVNGKFGWEDISVVTASSVTRKSIVAKVNRSLKLVSIQAWSVLNEAKTSGAALFQIDPVCACLPNQPVMIRLLNGNNSTVIDGMISEQTGQVVILNSLPAPINLFFDTIYHYD